MYLAFLTRYIGRVALAMLGIVTDLQLYFRFQGHGINERIEKMWEALLGVFEIKEIYDERYKQLMEDKGIAAKASATLRIMEPECSVCLGARWVCEDHPDKPWDGASNAREACRCRGAGAPRPSCNPSDREHRPEMPEGYRSFLDSRGSTN